MKNILITACLIFSFLLSTATLAATGCKGKSKSSCMASDKCTWVSSYKNKSGNTVKAYCRAAPGKAKSMSKTKSEKVSKKAKSTKAKKTEKPRKTKKSVKTEKQTTKKEKTKKMVKKTKKTT